MGYRVNIAGVVGVGKSSLTNLIWNKWKFVPFREPVFDNPLLDKFYYDKKRYAFPLQVFFLNKRFEMCKKSLEYGSSVMDRSIIEDTIFAKMLRDSGDMDPYEYQIYRELFNNMMEHVVQPDLMVYLKVQPEEAVRRIRKRGREYEVKNDTDYWYTLSQNYNEFFYDYNWSKLLTIDCDDLDFVNNQNDQDYILDQIDGALGQMKKQKRWVKNRLRYVFKTFTYKTISIAITILAGWLLTGSPAIGLSLGLVEVTVKLFIYYLHEEVWSKIDFGKQIKIKSKKKKKKKKKRVKVLKD